MRDSKILSFLKKDGSWSNLESRTKKFTSEMTGYFYTTNSIGSVFHPSSSDHVTISTQSKSSAVVIPDPLDNLSSDSSPATDPANGLANLSHSGSD